MLIAAGSVSVDTFFLISGLLVSVGVLRELDSRRTFNYPLYILHRYLRLTPAFGVLIILFVTGIKYFGSGPLWTSFLNMSVLPCQKYWWTALLYIQNYYNPEEIVCAKIFQVCIFKFKFPYILSVFRIVGT